MGRDFGVAAGLREQASKLGIEDKIMFSGFGIMSRKF